jgi:hypothetical protein
MLTLPSSSRMSHFLMGGGGVLWTHLSGRHTNADPSQGGPSRRQKKERTATLEDERCCTPILECSAPQGWKVHNYSPSLNQIMSPS